MKSMNVLKYLLLAYVISTGFTEVLDLPWSQVQIPELIFIPLFTTWFVSIGWKSLSSKIQLTGLDVSLLLLVIVYTISSLITGTPKSLLETIGLAYLLLVYLVFKTSLPRISNSSAFFHNAFVTCGIIAALSGIIGWTLVQLGTDNPMAWSGNRVYPYLGSIGRAEGFNDTPNMLLNLLAVCFLIFFSSYLQRKDKKIKDLLILIIMIICIILTFSKSILVFIIALIFILHAHGYIRSTAKRFVAVATSIILFLVFVIGSHILIIKKTNVDWEMLTENAYTLDHPLMEIGNYYLVQTNYSVNKIASIRAGIEHLIFGVGPGGFNEYVKEAKRNGDYPAYFPAYDPHSIYSGTFAELGIAGVLSLSLVFSLIIKKLNRIAQINNTTNSELVAGITACFIFLALDGIVLDMLNFRHLWVLLAILGVLPYKLKSADRTIEEGHVTVIR